MGRSERKHLTAWLLVPVLAVANGVIRDLTYGRGMSQTVAHSVAVVPLVVAILAWAVFLTRRWPLPDRSAAVRVGAVWFGATIAFELALGVVLHVPFATMLAAYDVTRGNLWPIVPLTMALAPVLAPRLSRWWRRRVARDDGAPLVREAR